MSSFPPKAGSFCVHFGSDEHGVPKFLVIAIELTFADEFSGVEWVLYDAEAKEHFQSRDLQQYLRTLLAAAAREPLSRGVHNMGELIVIEFPSEAKAEEVRQRFLNNMLKEYHIQPYDAVIATKQADGNVKLNELLRPTGTGAASRLSDLIGMFLPFAGALVGVASEALYRALTDVGINDRFIKDVSACLDGGNAALFLLIRRKMTDKVLEELKGVGGKVLRTSFDHAKEEALQKALAAAKAAKTAPTS